MVGPEQTVALITDLQSWLLYKHFEKHSSAVSSFKKIVGLWIEIIAFLF